MRGSGRQDDRCRASTESGDGRAQILCVERLVFRVAGQENLVIAKGFTVAPDENEDKVGVEFLNGGRPKPTHSLAGKRPTS